MKVVLLQEVAGIGGPGTVKDVADGYARNYLLPRKLATPATTAALKQIQQSQQAAQRKQEKEEAQAAAVAGRIQGQQITFRVRAGEEGRLYGSVTNSDIADVLARKLGMEVDKRRVLLDEPIHVLGTYEVPVRLSATHSPVVKVIVEAEA
ncbi:MAG: 50S ribosomal protein L9 [Chloroflexota bacterium]|nr:50S ribosomal protein L9 [Chloroflexota bacterium]